MAEKNPAAQAFGRMGAGVPKRYSSIEISIRTQRIQRARQRHLALSKRNQPSKRNKETP